MIGGSSRIRSSVIKSSMRDGGHQRQDHRRRLRTIVGYLAAYANLHQNISSAQQFRAVAGLDDEADSPALVFPGITSFYAHLNSTTTKAPALGPGLDGRRCSCLGAGMVARAVRILNADDQALVPYPAAMAATEAVRTGE